MSRLISPQPSLSVPAKKDFAFTGWHMLAVMVLFFGTVIAVNVTMALNASRTWTGLVVENSYVASQEFNAKLATARAQMDAGWHGSLNYDRPTLVFTLQDGNDAPLPVTHVEIAMNRPIGVSGDRTLVLEPVGDGRFIAEITLDAGVWNATIRAKFADQPDYEHRARLTVPEVR